jgi:hypothetical protein
MTVDDATGNAEFDPSMTFINYPAIYNFYIFGLPMTSLSDFDFVYLSPDGTIQPIKNSGIVIDKTKGFLQVKSALLPHFSRYGFINKD